MKNPYEDSPEKDTIRKIDKKYLVEFVNNKEFVKYNYLGLPSVEFYDLRCWEEIIGFALGCEEDKDVCEDMKLNVRKFNFEFPIRIKRTTIENEIKNLSVDQDRLFNLYNLDYCSGLFYSKKFSTEKVDSLKNIFNHQSKSKNNFVLITTINVRDKGAAYMDKWLKDFFNNSLKQVNNVEKNLEEHTTDQMGRYKLYFLTNCYNFSTMYNFKQFFSDVLRYKSNRTHLIHFVQKFIYDEDTIQNQVSIDSLKKIANISIFQIAGENNPLKKNPIIFTKLE